MAILKNMTSQATLGYHFLGGLWAQGLSFKCDICIKRYIVFYACMEFRVVYSNILTNSIQNIIRLHKTRQKTSLTITQNIISSNKYISQLTVETSSALF